MDRLMKIGELAARMDISRSTAFRLKRKDAWPHVRIGTEIRFTEDDYQAIVKLYHQQPTTKTVPNVGTRAKRRNNK